MKILQFSGGKDSLACLYLLEPQWQDITVMWGNTGAAYESTINLMNKVKAMVPNFIEIKSDQPAFLETYGYPCDVLPLRNTRLGHLVHSTNGTRFTDYFSCCNANIWQPLDNACKKLGATTIYRGQRLEDEKKGTVPSGAIIEGCEYIFPIETWTTSDVKKYLGEKIPEYYKNEKSSHDCWNCTAYLEDNATRINSLPADKKAIVASVLRDMRNAIKNDTTNLDEVINGLRK